MCIRDRLQTVSKKSKKIARLLRKIFLFSATDYFACSDAAAEWLFPKRIYQSKKYTIANNGINIEKFRYNQADRIRIREKYHIPEDTIVVGSVGRFMEQKNHKFMLEVFKTFHEEKKNSVLFLVGEGKLEDAVRTQVKKLQLEHSVIFCGTTPYVAVSYTHLDVYKRQTLLKIHISPFQRTQLPDPNPCIKCHRIAQRLIIQFLPDPFQHLLLLSL